MYFKTAYGGVYNMHGMQQHLHIFGVLNRCLWPESQCEAQVEAHRSLSQTTKSWFDRKQVPWVVECHAWDIEAWLEVLGARSRHLWCSFCILLCEKHRQKISHRCPFWPSFAFLVARCGHYGKSTWSYQSQDTDRPYSKARLAWCHLRAAIVR